MFERLDQQARSVFDAAQREARSLHHSWIGTEHLLLALALDVGPVSDLLARYGARPDDIRSDIVRIIGRGRPASQPDVLLATLGIDLGEVRRRVESAFGPDAVDRAAQQVTRPRRGRRRRRCPDPPRRTSTLTGAAQLNLAPRVKHALEIAVRRGGGRPVSPAGLLTGILEEGQGVACLILSRRGLDLGRLALEVRTL